jgi:hypothetical protein
MGRVKVQVDRSQGLKPNLASFTFGGVDFRDERDVSRVVNEVFEVFLGLSQGVIGITSVDRWQGVFTLILSVPFARNHISL